MSSYCLTQLDDVTLLRQLSALVAGERAATAVTLAHIAEVDVRRLYVPAGYASMYAYLVSGLGLSEGAAFRRVQSARAARRFPVLFEAVAGGRLHLTAISMLAPHLRESNADELIAAATDHRTRSELQAWLARRFPAEGAMLPPARVRVVGVAVEAPPTAVPLLLAPASPREQPNSPISGEVNWAVLSAPRVPPGSANVVGPKPDRATSPSSSEGPGVASSPGPGDRPAEPVAQPYFVLKVALGEVTHAKLERAQVLLAHRVRVGEIAEVLDRALDALLAKLEYRRSATASSPRIPPGPPGCPSPREPTLQRPPRTERTDSRGVPASVRREVWEREGGRCTFTGPTGHQCGAERGLEFDHIQPVARGGASTASNLRLRCRAHNQFEAERQFGREFMEERRKRDPQG